MNVSCVFLIFAALAATISGETCCDGVGCFSTSGDWKHLPSPKCPEKMGIDFALFTQGNMNSPHYMDRDSVLPSVFSKDRRTLVIFHGYLSSYRTKFMHEIKDAILATDDVNVIIVGWGGGANEVWYPNSAANTRTVAAETALIIDRLKTEAGATTDFYCIGFSLGAHTCGFLGYTTEIDRITGLDPAGPWFDGQAPHTRLTKDAAKYVDVIHTDGSGILAYYGLLTPSGHTDFYPNEGKYQPGCVTGLPDETMNTTSPNLEWASDWVGPYGMGDLVACSHNRAPHLFVESIKNRNCFITRHHACTDVKKLPKSCSGCGEGCHIMGYGADTIGTHGNFYLTTSRKSPYCHY